MQNSFQLIKTFINGERTSRIPLYALLLNDAGIDVSQLLPFGKPQAIKEIVKKTIDDAEGIIMIGSSTEVNNEVPLENFIALREAVLEYK
jgi:hypothetical protein